MRGVWLAGVAAALSLLAAAGAEAAFVPWAPLTNDSWICFDPADPKLTVHTVNGGDYPIGFDQARLSDNGARGMKALKFSDGSATTGHLSSSDPAGSFDVLATGSRSFSDLLLLVVIDADQLPVGFACSIGRRGQAPTQLDPADDFGFYDPTAPTTDHDTGRPSGYYSITDPPGEPIAYDFDRGMVSIVALPQADLSSLAPVTIDYAFEDLPGRAVFSVYGQVSGMDWIYHTNRAVTDNNAPGAPVSTFEVVPEPGVAALLACVAWAPLWRRRR